MNKQIFLLSAFFFILSSCHTDTVTDKSSQDEQFDEFKKYYVEQLLKMSSSRAIAAGRHDYDSILHIPSAKLYEEWMGKYKVLEDSLKKYDESRLSESNQIDYRMIINDIEGSRWSIKEYREYEWNPAVFNVCGDFAEILNGRYASLNDRLTSFRLRLPNVKEFYSSARTLIKDPVAEHTDLAILQHEGSVEEIFGAALKDSVVASTLPEKEKAELIAGVDSAHAAVIEHVDWLKEKKAALVNGGRSFRLGKKLYEDLFRYNIVSAYTAKEIYEKAVKRRAELHGEMARLSRTLWPQYFKQQPIPDDSLQLIRQMIDRLSLKHVQPSEFMSAIEMQIPQLVSFINEKNLLYIDPSKPLVVRKTPAYMEGGGAGASISAPGPFDKNANTYYNVSPLTGYTPEQAESYLREYNEYILQILNIHEAIPGHYTQLVYSNRSPSIIKSMMSNGAMVEGWAVYAERMMLENGYGGNEPEMWLMYYKWHLRSVCNTILDYSVHVNNMSEAEAKDLLINGAFQQSAEAEGKWRRVRLTQVQLCSYFTGYTEIYELREELKAKQGDKFSLKDFHEKFLSYGSAPVKYIRELMLNWKVN